jgi:hypothetical protein
MVMHDRVSGPLWIEFDKLGGMRMVPSDERKPPRLTAPKGACDTHTHFHNAKFPSVLAALITPPDAGANAYRPVQNRKK